jgi:hypothetical protein
MNSQDVLVTVGLYLLGDQLDPEKVSEELGIVPTTARRKGEKRVTATGREYTSKTGVWSLVMSKDHAEVAGVAGNLLAALAHCRKPIRTLTDIHDAYFDVFIAGTADNDGEGSCEFEIDGAQLAALAQHELPIRFKVSIGHD